MADENEPAAVATEPPTLDAIVESMAKEHARYLNLNNSDYLQNEVSSG
jgi:hypothetical protein